MSPSMVDHVDRFEEAARRLAADLDSGLTPDEAHRRLAAGRNELPSPPVQGWISRIAKQLRDPMALLLLAAAALSLVALRKPGDAAAIGAIVILNVVVAVIQEEKAVSALEALRSAAAPTARVLRSGIPLTVPAAEVVPGDIVLLAAGERVPADLWLVEAWSLEADESLLTGESLPVAKAPAATVDPDLPVADRSWMLHAGTLITAGSAHALTVATGPVTAMGRLATHLVAPPTTTPLQRRLARLSTRLGQSAIAIAIAVFGLMVLRLGTRAGAVEEAFLAAVALAVAAVPEGLPTVVTLSLALGVRRMARAGAIVRNLPAVETLGSTTVLLTDKTGTLTQNRMTFELVVPPGGRAVPPDDLSVPIRAAVEAVAVLCNDASLDPAQGDPVDLALLERFPPARVDRLRTEHPRVGNLPFDSQRKMMSTVHRADGGLELLGKGAPEPVLAASTFALAADGSRHPLTVRDREATVAEAARLAGSGMRVLALAMREIDSASDLEAAEHELVLVGLAVLRDPLRPEAAATVRTVSEAGVRLVMVTGDHAGTASAVATAVGLNHEKGQILTGADVRASGLPDDPASAVVYARVDPEQKLALVKAFQDAGHVVAVTGDGVNDAPALRRADIGVAMGKGGSDVAREAADLIITSDDLGLVTVAVREGRAIFDNIRKVVDYLVAGNLSEITVVLAGLAFFPGLGVPLLPLQLLWINLLTDGLPALALGFDRPRRELLRRAPGLRTAELLTTRRVLMLTIRALILAGGAITALTVARAQGGSWQEGRTVMFTSLVVAHLLYAFVVRLPSTAANPRLALAVALGLALQAGTILGPARDLFGVVPISPAQWALAIGAGLAPAGILALYQRTASARRLTLGMETRPAVPPGAASRREP